MRVADEVREHLPDAPLVGAREDARLALDADRHGSRADDARRLAHDLPRDGGEVDARARQLELPALERAELEDVVDEIEQVLARPANLLDLLARLGGQRAVDLGHQDVGEAEDGVQRAPQLVADGREERGAIAVGRAHALEVALVARLRRGEAIRRAR